MTLRDLDNRLRHREKEDDDVARVAWYHGLFVKMAMSDEKYPASPEDWTPSALAREAEERRKFNESWTVDEVFDEIGDPI